MVKSRHEVVSTENSPYAKLVGVSIANVEMYGFLGNYLRKAATSTLPRIYELLEETSRLDNFRIAAGKKEGTFMAIGLMIQMSISGLKRCHTFSVVRKRRNLRSVN